MITVFGWQREPSNEMNILAFGFVVLDAGGTPFTPSGKSSPVWFEFFEG